MKKYLKYIIIIAAFLIYGCTQQTETSAENYAAADEVKYLRQIITDDASVSRTVMWQSDAEIKNPVAEFKSSDNKITAVPASMQELNTGTSRIFVYTAELTGLNPDSTYEYRAG